MAASAEQADGGGELTRRQLFRRGGTIAAGAAATVTVGSRTVPRYSPVGRAAAVAPAVAIGIVAGAAAIAYIGGKAADAYLGDSEDYSGYTGADALRTATQEGIVEMKSADERVMTSIENNIANSENIALAKGKAAIIEEMNAGNSETDAQTAMQNAIDDYYTTIEKNILTHWNAQFEQFRHHYEQFDAHADLTAAAEFHIESTNDTNWSWNQFNSYSNDNHNAYVRSEETQITLLNGDTMQVWRTDVTSDYYRSEIVPSPDVSYGKPNGQIRLGSSSGYEYTDPVRIQDAFATVATKRDDVNSQLSGFVSDVYANYEPGDIPTEDLVDPVTAATEMNQDYDDRGFRSAQAAILGIPTSAEFSADLEIVSDEAEDGIWEVNADIFTSHTPTDSDGNEVGFEVGETYQPSSWSEPLYIAYSYVDEISGDTVADFTQIESEFTIVSVQDVDGNKVTSFKPESQNNQTADVAALEEELAQIREAQIRMQKESQEDEPEDPLAGLVPSGMDWSGAAATVALVGGGAMAIATSIGIVYKKLNPLL